MSTSVAFSRWEFFTVNTLQSAVYFQFHKITMHFVAMAIFIARPAIGVKAEFAVDLHGILTGESNGTSA